MEHAMSQAPALTPPPRSGTPNPELTLPPPTGAKAPGAAGEQFRRLLDAKPSEGPARVAVSDPRPFVPAPESALSSPAREPDAPRSSGAQIRQQQPWAQSQREAAPDNAAALLANVQAPGGAVAVAASPYASAAPSARPDNDFVALLLDQCSQMYVAYVAQGPQANSARVLLDLGHTLPGSLVELAREGAFLRVRLHAADAQAGQLMDAQRERLVAALERSTRLGVVVDVVRTR
jgi:hypothetical protein